MTDRRILEEAQSAAANAYVPYSHFPVAAVLELKDGTLLSGCNVENASYGLCMCAERNVLFMSVACGVPKEEIASLTVYTHRVPHHTLRCLPAGDGRTPGSGYAGHRDQRAAGTAVYSERSSAGFIQSESVTDRLFSNHQ